MGRFFVYVIETEDHKYYTGQTNDLLRRFKEHVARKSHAATFFRMHPPKYLVYVEEVDSRTKALRRERQIKIHRRLKMSLIGSRRDLLEVIDSEASYR